MDAILQQKKKGQTQFRIQIDQLLTDSLFTKQQDQLTTEVIQQIFCSSQKQGLFQNGKVSIDKLMEAMYDSGNHFSTKEFAKIFNNKKQIRPQEIFQVLKSYELTEFDLQQEIMKHFFDDGSFSIKKLDKVMGELGYNQLNRKDKEIMVECFDYDRDNHITQKDLNKIMNVVVGARQEKKNKRKTRKQSTLKTTI